ncbi:MAG: serine/threonine protein phosphatase, partial [Acaryochloridaceae cyanobacterium RL_2_7]|nr:serine/threonine protein phosphatase [Acaryochloridaceae cyanobacterium RL_2_7]
MLTTAADTPAPFNRTPESRRIIIGDVHGHYDGLLSLIDFLELKAADELYFLGDLVDRGPKSAQVVEFVKSSGYPCLRGNHEELMIAACNQSAQDYSVFQMWASCGGHQTLDSYNSPDLLQEHVAWFKTLPTYIDLGDLWLVHAGVDPTKELEQQTAEEFCWIRSAFHKSSKPFFEDKLIVTGHTITFTLPQVEPGQIAQGIGWISIDTGAYHPKSGWLTAYDSTQAKIFQVNVF